MSRRVRVFLIISGLLFSSASLLGQAYVVDFDNLSLKTAIRQLESKYDLSFSYEEAVIAEERVSLQMRTDELDVLLQQLLRNTGVTYDLVDERFVTLYPRPAEQNPEPLYSFCGYVRDSLSNTPLGFANAYLLQSQVGSGTNEQGYFSFRTLASLNDTLVISYVGYKEQRLAVRDFLQTDCPEILLPFLVYGENLIVVTDYLTQGIALGRQGFSTNIQPASLPALPGQVEPDVLQSLQFLPGVSSPDGSVANIHIRGSTPDQNLILWEDIPVYHSAHYFGSISAFNPFVIDQVDILRGGFGADYGGRIAGIVDLKTEAIGEPGLSGGMGTNLYTAFGHARVVSQDQRHGGRISLRRALTDIGQAPFFSQLRFRNQQQILQGNFTPRSLPNGVTVSDDFNFWDTQLKYSLNISERDQIHLAGIYAENQFDNVVRDDRRQQDHIDDLDLQHLGAKMAWERTWSSRWKTRVLGTSTNLDYDYSFVLDNWDPKRRDGGGRRDNEIAETQFRTTAIYSARDQWQLRFGYQLTNYDNNFLILEDDEEVNIANQSGGVIANLHTVFASYGTAKQNRTGVRLGLRGNHYSNDGKLYWEPRLQLWHQANEAWRLQLAAGRYHQFLSQLVEFKGAQMGINNPIWILADERKVSVLSSTQVQAGAIYQENGWLADIQLYHKQSTGLTALGIGFLPGPQQGFDLGEAEVTGLDILLKKRWGKFSTWLSYSLSEVNYEFPSFFDTNFSASFDQRHQFKWANVWQKNDWTISLGWQWSSGLPYSLMRDFRLRPNDMGELNIVEPIYTAYNDQRLVGTHQLDASFLYRIQPKKSTDWSGVLGVALINLYDQRNVYSREYFVENRPNFPRRISFEESINVGFVPNFIFRVEWK